VSDRSSSVGKAAARGAAWLTLQTLSARVFSLLSQLVLAWILTPSDFGLIGLAFTVTQLARTLVSFGVDDVLLQRQRTIRLWQSSAFWTSLALALLGTAVVIVAAPIAARVYHTPKLVGLVLVMVTAMPIGALSTVSAVTIRAQMGFRFIALYNTFEIAATQVLTIILAALHLGAFSFALPLPILAVTKTVLFWVKSPPKISTRLRKFQFSYLASSGSKVFLTRLLIESVSQGDYITLGVMTTHALVGSYFFAFRIAAQPLRLVAGNFSNVLFPAFAQINREPDRQLAAALNASRLLAYVAMPLCFLQAAAAGPFLHLIFGQKWSSAISLVQALSIGLPFDAVSWVAGSLMSARGEFRRQLLLTASLTPLFFGLVIIGAVLASVEGVAWGVTIYYLVTGPIYGLVAFGRQKGVLRAVADLYLQAPLVAALCVGLAWDLGIVVSPAMDKISVLIRLAVTCLVGPAVYVVSVRLIVPGVLTDVIERIGLKAPLARHRLQRALGGRS
jgi:O-antigen/teichoic acid export membrane protein